MMVLISHTMKFHGVTKFFICSLLGICMSSCKSVIKDPKLYYSYLENPANGLVKEKTVAGIKLKVKYLPLDYLAFNSLDKKKFLTQAAKDSVMKAFDNSLTFILNIGPSQNESFDVTRVGIDNYGEFAERVERMSFQAQEWITIKIGEKIFRPVLARMENLNALEKSRNFIIVFNSKEIMEEEGVNDQMCFIYNDELFDIGTNKFVFQMNDIKTTPELKF
ncbi:hypothetical protein CNR22_00125 [Sphingobacteriaceae bacterium]|nr:hypothetical protein CNR22_00125 [Sphingobacteriaceae bacterium]